MSIDRGVVSLVLAESFDKSNHWKQSAARFRPIGSLFSSTNSTPLSIVIAITQLQSRVAEIPDQGHVNTLLILEYV